MNRKLSIGAITLALSSGLLLARCSDPVKTPVNVEKRPNSCDADLTPFLSTVGNTVVAKKIEDPSELIGGEAANGRVGDYLLRNDKIRVIIQAPDRHIGANPYGGQIIDADLVHEGPGRDAFGKIALFFNFGRTQEATAVSVFNDSKSGAVIAADGVDRINDFLNVNSVIEGVAGTTLAVDPEKELGLKITNYYVLNSGENRVRVVSALCNTSDKALSMPVGDLIDSGGNVEFFGTQSCTGGFGYSGCLVDNMSWYGFQGKGVAYGYAPWLPTNATQPSLRNGVLVVSGVAGILLATGDKKSATEALLGYSDATAKTHESDLVIPAGFGKLLVRDFVVGRDIGEVASSITVYRNGVLGLPLGDVKGVVTDAGKPIAGARVALERNVVDPSGTPRHVIEATFVTDADGAYGGKFAAADYTISAWARGRVPSDRKPVSLPSGDVAKVDFALGAPRTLSLEIKDLDGNPMPGKLTLLCETNPCPVAFSSLVRFFDTVRDKIPDNVAVQDYVGPTGKATFQVPPGKYRAVVTRGPEWSAFPTTWAPATSADASTGFAVDLTAGDGAVSATLARVIDSTGWMSADFHVHAINSPDSYVENQDRLVSFMGEGVDALVITDHDFVTDLGPLNESIGGSKFLKTVVGTEITTFDYGHTNAFPLVPVEGDIYGGNIDWADGPNLSLPSPKIFDAARARGAKTVHINHPRGSISVFTAVKIDTDTGKTHMVPKKFRVARTDGSADLDAEDAGQWSDNVNALEVFNSGSDHYDAKNSRPLMNDWFTFLSRGVLVAASGVSDTHVRFANAPGYYRTYVNVGSDDVSRLDPLALSENLNKLKAVASLGPFVQLTAHKIDGTGAKVGSDVGIGETLATGGASIELTVDVQAPPYLKLGRIEIISHIPGGDGVCPAAGDLAKFPKSRVACKGVENTNWPKEGVVASADLTAADVVTEKAAEKNGVAYNRSRVTKKFTLPAAPAKDTWFVAIVYGPEKTTSFPLFHSGVDVKTRLAKDAPTFAATNPVFIDADGGGYDKFPSRQYAPAKQAFDGPIRPAVQKPLFSKPRGMPLSAEQFERFYKVLDEHENE